MTVIRYSPYIKYYNCNIYNLFYIFLFKDDDRLTLEQIRLLSFKDKRSYLEVIYQLLTNCITFISFAILI